MNAFPYWGRCYSLGNVPVHGRHGFVLALAGVFARRARTPRPTLVALAIVVVLLVLAWRGRAVVSGVLYDYVPGFNKFRSNSKFIFPARSF